MVIQMVTVSVVIPTFNRMHTINRAISSVLFQTYYDFELIVVDDGSDDGTEQIVEKSNDSRLRYIKHSSNEGGSAARNTGIRLAKGKYIAFLDDDDEWLPTKLSKQVSLLSKSPASIGVVYTGFRVFTDIGKPVKTISPAFQGYILDKLIRRNCVGTTSTVLVKKEVFKKVGGFDEKLPSMQDWDMWLRIGKNYEFKYISEPLVNYYTSTKSLTKSTSARVYGITIFFNKHEHLFSKKVRSYYLMRIGTSLCLSGDMRLGRRYVLRAVADNLGNPNYVMYAFLTTLGRQIFSRLYNFIADLNVLGTAEIRRKWGID